MKCIGKPIYKDSSKALTPELRKARLAMLPKNIIPVDLNKTCKSFMVPKSLGMGRIVVNLARGHYYAFALPAGEKLIDWRAKSGRTAKEAWELVKSAMERQSKAH